ncbi:MAG: hypothetical protein AAFR96_07030 [Planctomycetota bacterium]
MASESNSRAIPAAEALGALIRAAEFMEEWLQRVADRLVVVVNDVVTSFTRGYQAADSVLPSLSSPSPSKPLTPDQQAVWDQLATGIKSAKEVAIDLGFEASNEEMIRKRVARMRSAGWKIEHVPGRGYWRPDAVDLDGASC